MRRGAGLLARVVLAGLALAGLALAVAPIAAADDGASWGIRPADAAHGVARDNFRATATPGAVIEDALVVTNRGAEALDLRVLASDGELTADGLVELAPADEAPAGFATWVVLGVERLELGPGESTRVPFTIRVPTDAAPGPVAGAVVTSSLAESAEPGVAVDRRLAASVVIEVVAAAGGPVPGPGVPGWAVLVVVGLALAAVATWAVVLRGRATG